MPPLDLVHRQVTLEQRGGNAPTLIEFQPWAFPPVDSIPIDVVDVQTVPLGTTVTIPIIATETNRAVFRFFGNESTAAAGYTDLRWTILINGLPHQPYVNMQQSRGLLSNPDPIMIYLPRASNVQVQVQNLSAVAGWEAKTRLKGWIF